jgi:hypothetical protein
MTSTQNGQPTRFTPLDALVAIAEAGGGCHVDVNAEAASVGELMQTGPALEPDEFVATRTIVLQQGDSRCEWVLWADNAKRYGENLAGHRVEVHGARVQAYNRRGLPRLVGCEYAEIVADEVERKSVQNASAI